MSLPKKRDCTGCGACFNVCPCEAITLQHDEHGFLYPLIDDTLCIQCKMCEEVCPAIVPLVRENALQPRVYACWHKDEQVRKSSTSGGLFSAIAESVLSRNGIVFASQMKANLEVEYARIDAASQLLCVRGSKYTQSNTKNVFQQAERSLNEHREVFFVGCPCQVAALYSFLKGKDTTNLFSADLICHGVASDAFFHEYIDWREKQAKKKVISFSPRDKSRGWHNLTIKIGYEDGTYRLISSDRDPFMRAYYAGLVYRESCYHCVYSSLPRVADITLGDYFAVRDDKSYLDQLEHGVSMVLVNNKKGEKLFEDIEPFIQFKERTLAEALETNECLSTPVPLPKNRERFFLAQKHNMRTVIIRYCPMGFRSLVAKILGKNMTELIKRVKKKYYARFRAYKI